MQAMHTEKTPHQSIRLFENDLLERLSHVHPITPLLLWGPVALWLFWRAARVEQIAPLPLLALALAGAFSWTFVEYWVHRLLFHYRARSRAGQFLVFLFHGNHHQDPMDKTRLVFPPAGAIPIMAVFYLLFSLLIPQPWLTAFFPGFIVGYLMYDYIHYATHHFHMRNPVAKMLKHHHLRHHFSGKPGRYGVSSPLWDLVFGTIPN